LPKVNFSRIHLPLNPDHNYWQPPKKHFRTDKHRDDAKPSKTW
jgi:hypothetical protein